MSEEETSEGEADVTQRLQELAQRMNNVEYAQQTQAAPAAQVQPQPSPEAKLPEPPVYPEPSEDESVQEYHLRMKAYHEAKDAYQAQVAKIKERAAAQNKAAEESRKHADHVRAFFKKNPEAKSPENIEELRSLVMEKKYSIEDAWDLVRLRKAEKDAQVAAKAAANKRPSLKASESSAQGPLSKTFENSSDAIYAAIDHEIATAGPLESLPLE